MPAKPLDKGKILGFRVADKNIIVSNEKGVCDFPLCRKDFPLPGVPKISPFGF